MPLRTNSQTPFLDLEYDAEQTLWRKADSDRGTELLRILSGEFKSALREMHRHVMLRNVLRRSQNLAQIQLFVGFGGGYSEILPIDDILAEIVKEGAAGDGDLQILCRWSVDRNGKPVFPHQPGRTMEARRTIKLEELRMQSENLIAWADDCAAEADMKGGTWLKRRSEDPAWSQQLLKAYR
ncbi:MAG: hypothetical protein QM780_02930 [Hyphomicrobium sp.]|uniref:hypothetical protein n=1 Tax=Hyphomicrobium sp. TaxID=82 RepID=UPI0039E57A2E